MAIPTFNDGDPIDAAQLQELSSAVSLLQGTIANSATAGTVISVENETFVTSPTKFFGSRTKNYPLKPGAFIDFDIDYSSAGFTANPKAITFGQLYTGKNDGAVYMPQVRSLTQKDAKCRVLCPKSATGGTVAFYFIVVQ
jgi:hypothetical protein